MDNIAAIKSKIFNLKESKENLTIKKAISGDKTCLSQLIKENKIDESNIVNIENISNTMDELFAIKK